MKRSTTLIALFLGMLLINVTASAQMTKEEKSFWKKKAKLYSKNPLSLKAEFENYQNQIKDLKKQNKELSSNGPSSSQNSISSTGNQAGLVDSLRFALVQMEGQLQAERNNSQKLQSAYKTQKTVNKMGIQDGLVYRVQIGAFVFYEMENKPGNSDDFLAERSDGFNKYVIGSFRTQNEGDTFRDSLRKIGIKDAWVVPYIDGIRVTMQEADNYLAGQGSQLIMGN